MTLLTEEIHLLALALQSHRNLRQQRYSRFIDLFEVNACESGQGFDVTNRGLDRHESTVNLLKSQVQLNILDLP